MNDVKPAQSTRVRHTRACREYLDVGGMEVTYGLIVWAGWAFSGWSAGARLGEIPAAEHGNDELVAALTINVDKALKRKRVNPFARIRDIGLQALAPA